jgi:ABC-2 type transport system permease protein
MVVLIFVFIELWTVTFGVSGHGSFAGFDLRRMIWYLVITESVVLSCPRTFDRVDQEVKAGDIAYTLTKPYSYGLFHAAGYFGNALLTLPVNFVVGASLAWIAVGPPPVSLTIWPVVAAAVLLAIALNFAVEFMIGLSAFWFEDTFAFYWIYQKLTFTLGGLFLPLTFFPGWLKAIAQRLPFSSITYAPARLVAGEGAGTVASTIATQIGWLVVLGTIAVLVFRHGVRQVNVNGG